MMRFTNPLYLILFVPLAYYSYRLSRQSFADLSRLRSGMALGLRLLILAMLILALAGARSVRLVSKQCVVFAVDVSESISKEKQDAALKYVNDAVRSMKKDQQAAIVVFGGDATVELAPSNLHKVDKIYSVPNTKNTDIAQALGLALAVFPDQCAKKIVLLSDGNETRGKAIEQAILAGAEDVSVDVVPTHNELIHEALLDKLVCPSNAKVGEPFDLKVVASSKEATSAQIRILRNGSPIASKNVELAKGKSMFSFEQSIPKAGNYEFRAILDCTTDTRPENNVATGYTMVSGKPRVLYVEGDWGQEKYLSTALKRNDIDIETRDPSGIPNSLAQLRGYDMVVFSDVPAWNMTPDQMTMIKSGVKDLGIGFTMIGGENSFGAGGYFDTPIEEALPVEMSIKKTKVLPSLSVIVVMDKSGSMSMPEDGVEKIRLANDAAAAVVKLLQPIDYVGVVVCHDYPVAAVPLRSAGDKNPIYNEISTIRAEGGGITVFPSMKMATDMMASSPTRQKHIILLADGSDCDEQEGTFALARESASKHVTISTVAFGDGPDVPFLKTVAAIGKGGYFLAKRGSDIKGIFTKDVMSVSKSLIIEEPFIPTMDSSSPELNGLTDSPLPPLLGYVATSPKSAAHVSMMSHKKDPILATWQYGLGRSAAFTSDCKAKWSSRWLGWSGYNKFWAQVLRSTMRKSGPADYQATVDVVGTTANVTIDAVDEEGNFINNLKFSGSVVTPSLRSCPLTIEQTAPGRYEATFDTDEVGSYLVNILKDKTQAAPEISVVNIPYPPEYKAVSPNINLLKQLATSTSGVYSPKTSAIFNGSFRKTESYTDLWMLLIILSMFLLPVDVAVRRLTITSDQAEELLDRMSERVQTLISGVRKRRRKEETAVDAVSSLLQSKREKKILAQTNEDVRAFTSIERTLKSDSESRGVGVAVTRERVGHNEQNSEIQSDSGVTSRLLEAKKRAREKRE